MKFITNKKEREENQAKGRPGCAAPVVLKEQGWIVLLWSDFLSFPKVQHSKTVSSKKGGWGGKAFKILAYTESAVKEELLKGVRALGKVCWCIADSPVVPDCRRVVSVLMWHIPWGLFLPCLSSVYDKCPLWWADGCMICWTVFTTLWSAFSSTAVQLPYHNEM